MKTATSSRRSSPLRNIAQWDGFQTTYSSGTIRTDTPSPIGEADGERVKLTFDDGGKTLHRTSLSKNYLIPGKETAVHYSLRGVDGWHDLAVIDFQTGDIHLSRIHWVRTGEKAEGFIQTPHARSSAIPMNMSHTQEVSARE